MGWQWGGGWLSASGFSDFAGSTIVHACGGAAALAGIIVLGARSGRFTSQGGKRVMVPFAASSIPLTTLGTFWMKLPVGPELELLQIIATCGFTPLTDCQLTSVHVQFFLNLKIAKQVMEYFSRIGTRKSCQPVVSLTCPNCQPGLKQILLKPY